MESKLPFEARKKKRRLKNANPFPVQFSQNSLLMSDEWPCFYGKVVDDHIVIEDDRQAEMLYKNGFFGAFRSRTTFLYETTCGLGFKEEKKTTLTHDKNCANLLKNTTENSKTHFLESDKNLKQNKVVEDSDAVWESSSNVWDSLETVSEYPDKCADIEKQDIIPESSNISENNTRHKNVLNKIIDKDLIHRNISNKNLTKDSSESLPPEILCKDISKSSFSNDTATRASSNENPEAKTINDNSANDITRDKTISVITLDDETLAKSHDEAVNRIVKIVHENQRFSEVCNAVNHLMSDGEDLEIQHDTEPQETNNTEVPDKNSDSPIDLITLDDDDNSDMKVEDNSKNVIIVDDISENVMKVDDNFENVMETNDTSEDDIKLDDNSENMMKVDEDILDTSVECTETIVDTNVEYRYTEAMVDTNVEYTETMVDTNVEYIETMVDTNVEYTDTMVDVVTTDENFEDYDISEFLIINKDEMNSVDKSSCEIPLDNVSQNSVQLFTTTNEGCTKSEEQSDNVSLDESSDSSSELSQSSEETSSSTTTSEGTGAKSKSNTSTPEVSNILNTEPLIELNMDITEKDLVNTETSLNTTDNKEQSENIDTSWNIIDDISINVCESPSINKEHAEIVGELSANAEKLSDGASIKKKPLLLRRPFNLERDKISLKSERRTTKNVYANLEDIEDIPIILVDSKIDSVDVEDNIPAREEISLIECEKAISASDKGLIQISERVLNPINKESILSILSMEIDNIEKSTIIDNSREKSPIKLSRKYQSSKFEDSLLENEITDKISEKIGSESEKHLLVINKDSQSNTKGEAVPETCINMDLSSSDIKTSTISLINSEEIPLNHNLNTDLIEIDKKGMDCIQELSSPEPLIEISKDSKTDIQSGEASTNAKIHSESSDELTDDLQKQLQNSVEMTDISKGPSQPLEVLEDLNITCGNCLDIPILKKVSTKNNDDSPDTYYLLLEEALFLSYALGILIVKHEGVEIDIDEMWTLFCSLKNTFPVQYTIYHCFRIQGWVVQSGLKFGADWMLYPYGPAYYHGQHLVWVECLWKETLERDPSMSKRKFGTIEVAALERLASHVAKNVPICQVLRPKRITDEHLKSIDCMKHFEICQSVLKRWVQKEHQQ